MKRRQATARPAPTQAGDDDSYLVRMADETRKQFGIPGRNDTDTLKELIDEADVVFGIFPDPLAASGHRKLLIKGEALLDIIVADEKAERVHIAAIHCGRGIDEAEAMRLVFGDGAEADG